MFALGMTTIDVDHSVHHSVQPIQFLEAYVISLFAAEELCACSDVNTCIAPCHVSISTLVAIPSQQHAEV